MYKLIEFLRRIHVVLLFIIIEAIALNYYAHSSFYTQAKILSRANSVVGGLQRSVFSVKHFFALRSENEILSARVAELENSLAAYREREANMATDTLTMAQIDSTFVEQLTQYSYLPARIISNTINRNRNFITLNRGRQHGIMEDMAVITPDGSMVGYVVGCSDRYSVVISILNGDFTTSGKISGDEHFGSITWNGHSPHKVQMSELTKYAEFEEGAPVVSSGLSHIFPEGVKIGFVESFTENENQTSFDVVVRLAADMTKISNVLVISNNGYVEATELEQEVANR
ncbi:MAG: rod shape-determining protein MreC [Alistipes sp.]|nr:rod shape-determining protein MreC [Rikenellaceae bacterium]MBO5044353.1 rod shape-determining protein MreC [Alistipes sp.]MBO5276936.1 rod shape-determining protein MreC [Alistipes sp.]MBO5332159.1 rod shape-determining protein MreC [Alistipes sp.]MBP3601417.1 rod shape-determining protein MreC [Alistipes sp.]